MLFVCSVLYLQSAGYSKSKKYETFVGLHGLHCLICPIKNIWFKKRMPRSLIIVIDKYSNASHVSNRINKGVPIQFLSISCTNYKYFFFHFVHLITIIIIITDNDEGKKLNKKLNNINQPKVTRAHFDWIIFVQLGEFE